MTPQELKNSILQLAIQGKLVEQRPEEGTAEELFTQIQQEKKRLIAEKKIKKEKPLPEITEDEKPFDIPESWKWVKLGEIVTVLGGKRIPAGRQLTTENTGYKYIRVSDMKDGTVLTDGLLYIPSDIFPSIARYIIHKEDVYITVAGTIGRVGKIPEEIDGANLTENADRLVFSMLEQNWLIKCLESNIVQSQIANVTTKVGQPKLAIKRIQKLITPLPPLAEQKRIVAKFEELLPYIDRYEQAWSKLEQFNNLFPEDMKKSLLQYAIQGKLVEQRPEEGTAEELFARIQEEKQRLIAEKKNKKEKPLPEITEEEKPFDIPESWKWVYLLDIIEEKPSNGYSPKGVTYPTEIKNLTLTATTSGRFKDDAFKYVDISKEDASKYWLKNNDLLIQRSNSRELVGTSCIYTGADNAYIYPDLMMRMHVSSQVDIYYIDYVLKAPVTRNYYMASASGTSESMPKINQKIVSFTLVPLPPLAEQKRIVEKLEQLLPLCERLK